MTASSQGLSEPCRLDSKYREPHKQALLGWQRHYSTCGTIVLIGRNMARRTILHQ